MSQPVGELARRLGLGADAEPWLAELAAVTGPDVPLPDEAEATRLMKIMGIPAADAAEALTAAPDPDRQPELWWLLQRSRLLLASRLGDQTPLASWPDLPRELDRYARYFYLWVFLAASPALVAYHEGHGVPADITADTFADLGSKAALHRRTHGTGGLDKQAWFTLHFRGLLYALGRLQFNVDTARDRAGGPPPETPTLDAHIPESGPMTPAACDASFAAAPGFFLRHFGTRYDVAACTSWLMDDQLTEYLPAESNIVRFQRRFRLAPGGYEGDRNIIEFVFRRIDPDLDDLPQDTSLQRAVVSHLRAGRHWQVRTGWVDLA
ncbi:acyltransferase domain-containing protein [Actinocatenispora rupis]|uniref:Acyltransferase n=1 Tax=Actinocatenispora rupis TaxID=519421 RepID=A0A8J3NBW0_9ACTN|nr:acyltransferase domain-containing protein [Actinocatenispora rupis]GID11092.1 hypothetical protein Aru02nite_19810 [Actinocatenispora rupis]